MKRPKDDKRPPGARKKPSRVLNGDAREHDDALDRRTTTGSGASRDVSGRRKKGATAAPQAATCALVRGIEGGVSIPDTELGASGEGARAARYGA